MKKQLNFYILIILLVACGTPEKKQQVQKKQNPLAEGLCTSLKPDETCQEIKQETDSVQDFWNIFKSGEIEKAQDLISKMKKDLKDQPDNANLHKYYAFANTFYFAEYGRLNKDRDPSFMDAISDSISHFEKSLSLEYDIRAEGFLYSIKLYLAQLAEDQKVMDEDLPKLENLMERWPEWGYFVGAGYYALFDYNDKRYQRTFEYMFDEIQICAESNEKINRKNLLKHIKTTITKNKLRTNKVPSTNKKRSCVGSWIAPHALEGYYFNLADFFLKNGEKEMAKSIFELIKTVHSFDSWDFKNLIDARLQNLDRDMANFQKPVLSMEEPKFAPAMKNSCTICHQN